MKPRNREINIFNMSLLDILCGALGAFCFLMLVLFPFYSQDKGAAKPPDIPPPPASDPKSLEEALNRVHQLEDLLKKFQDYASQAGAQNKRADAENRQLQNDLKRAEGRAEQLEMRQPLLAIGRFTLADHDYVQIYIEDNREGDKGKGEPVDASKVQGVSFNGDFCISGEGAGLAYFLVRDTPPGGRFRVFMKVIKHAATDPPIRGYVTVQVLGQFEASPTIAAAAEHSAIPIAEVTVDPDRKQTIRMMVPKEALDPSSK